MSLNEWLEIRIPSANKKEKGKISFIRRDQIAAVEMENDRIAITLISGECIYSNCGQDKGAKTILDQLTKGMKQDKL